jgi:hypothetical protein
VGIPQKTSASVPHWLLDWPQVFLASPFKKIVCGRVDTARGPTRERSLAALAAAAVAGASGAAGRPVGSALYLLGSLFNHSCAPNLDVLFPAGDGARPRKRRGVTGVVACLRIVRSMRTCMLSLSKRACLLRSASCTRL